MPETEWYRPYVEYVAANKLMNGHTPTSFGPEDPITREQLATILWRYAGKTETKDSVAGFRDTDKISDWAEIPLKWAVENHIMGDKGDGILDPAGNATRAEVAKMIQCYIENVEKKL